MQDCRLDWPYPPQQRCRDTKHVHDTDADEQIFLDGSIGAPSNGARTDDFCQIVLHEDYIGRVYRSFGTAAAHRNADIGACQCRRIIDAVAHHRNPMALLLQFGDGRNFVFRHQVKPNLIHTEFACDGSRGSAIVAREHNDAFDTSSPEPVERDARAWSHSVGDKDDGDKLPVNGYMQRRLAAVLDGVGQRHAIFEQQFGIATRTARPVTLAFTPRP